MLKEARYKCWGWPFSGFPEFNKVVYVIVGSCCYFSGIERKKRTSTINAAESIIEAIAKQERIPMKEFRFFDLQTHRGYDKRPGEYEFDELILEENAQGKQEGKINSVKIGGEKALIITQDTQGFIVVSWRPSKCSSEILDIFREHID